MRCLEGMFDQISLVTVTTSQREGESFGQDGEGGKPLGTWDAELDGIKAINLSHYTTDDRSSNICRLE